MIPRQPLCAALLFCAAFSAAQQVAGKTEVLRGEVRVELEPMYGFAVDENPEGSIRAGAMEAPLDYPEARRRAAEESAYYFGAMIYGWKFVYDIGEKARGIPEELRLEPLAAPPGKSEIVPGDGRLAATDWKVEGSVFRLWSEYRPDAAQLRRMSFWRAGTMRTAQGVGYGPLGYAPAENVPDGEDAWLAVRKAAVEDAARAALRGALRGSERNRPKQAEGYISLAAFPRVFLSSGRWAAAGRFNFAVTEIVPFAAY
jgi:hypothetical protein